MKTLRRLIAVALTLLSIMIYPISRGVHVEGIIITMIVLVALTAVAIDAGLEHLSKKGNWGL